jgi:hypothetical protein
MRVTIAGLTLSKTEQARKHACRMRFVRWILIVPVALVAGVAGSLFGGVVASPFGQAAADTASAFAGPFAFVFAAGLVAPSARQRVGMVATALVAILALGTFVLSTFGNVEGFSRLAERARILTPVAQFLGALYALFIFPPFVIAGSTLERLWREILSLGVLVAMFGAALGIAGLLVGLTGHRWFVLEVGLGVLLLGAVTWLFPFWRAAGRVATLK